MSRTEAGGSDDSDRTEVGGHCDHCAVDCEATDGWHMAEVPVIAVWSRGCPACAERARIVQWLRDRRDLAMLGQWDHWPVVAAALSVAAGDIVLGNLPDGSTPEADA